MINREDNEDGPEAKFVRLVRQAGLFEGFAREAVRETLRCFVKGCGESPVGAYYSYVSTRAGLGEVVSRIQTYLKEETDAVAEELLSRPDATSEMIMAVLHHQNLEYARENGPRREDLQ